MKTKNVKKKLHSIELSEINLRGLVKSLIINRKFEKFVLAISIAVSGIFITAVILIQFFGFKIGNIHDYIVMAILSGTSIYGFYQYAYSRYIWKIDDTFPDFVRDLAESRKAGMTLTRAIMTASKGSYGPLTDEIKKMARQISWGASVREAFEDFAVRVNTPLIRRIISLINEASRGGGSVTDVLSAAAHDAREIQYLRKERKTNMASYVVVIYVSTMVFLVIILILVKKFLPMLAGKGVAQLSGAVAGGRVSSASVESVILVFFYAAIVQALGSGLVAGVFEEGKLSSGVKHAFILTLISWLAFRLFV